MLVHLNVPPKLVDAPLFLDNDETCTPEIHREVWAVQQLKHNIMKVAAT